MKELSYEDIQIIQGYLLWNQDGSKIAYPLFNSENVTTDIYTINVGKSPLAKTPVSELPTEKQPGMLGFEAVFAIAGLIAVAYLLRKNG